MTKKTNTETIRATRLTIITGILAFGYQSVRRLSQQLGVSKSSIQRHLQGLQRRNRYPESFFWETEAGALFLQRLYIAVLYQFGINNHLGAGQLSAFFRLIHLDQHIGVSENALRVKLRELDKQLEQFGQQQEAQATCRQPERTVAVDETFFHSLMVLVMMDLPSGYILLEEPANGRDFDTWNARTRARLKALGLTVRQVVSDRAKALIKLATKGFDCQSVADLFHAQYELSRWLSLPLARATQQAAVQLAAARDRLNQHQARQQPSSQETHDLTVAAGCAEQNHQQCIEAQNAYRQHQQAISDIVHPFDPVTGVAQDQVTVLTALQQESDAIATLAMERLITDPNARLAKFQRQQEDLSQSVGAWWLWVQTSLADNGQGATVNNWIMHQLMPVIYWHARWQQAKRKDDRRLYKTAWEKANQALTQHTLTPDFPEQQIAHWQQWCEEKVKHFQRTSSAVEGRNGRLSQLYHNGRGLTSARLKALTVIHNYGTRSSGETTPASQLFGQDFPDVFEYLLKQTGPLPLPRKRRVRKKPNPLIYNGCPA